MDSRAAKPKTKTWRKGVIALLLLFVFVGACGLNPQPIPPGYEDDGGYTGTPTGGGDGMDASIDGPRSSDADGSDGDSGIGPLSDAGSEADADGGSHDAGDAGDAGKGDAR